MPDQADIETLTPSSWTPRLRHHAEEAQQRALDAETGTASDRWQSLADLIQAGLGDRVDHASLMAAASMLADLISDQEANDA